MGRGKGVVLYERVGGMKVGEGWVRWGWEGEVGGIEEGEVREKEFVDGVLERVNEVRGEILGKVWEDGEGDGWI